MSIGADCQAVIKGIPERVSSLDIFVMARVKNTKKTGEAEVTDGKAELNLEPARFILLINK